MCDGAKSDLKYFLLEKSLTFFLGWIMSIAFLLLFACQEFPTNPLNHMYYEANCIEYTHFEVQQVIPRSEWCVCGATSLTWRGEGSCSLARSCLDPDGGEGGYLLNMPRPVWQPSHYLRPVISLKLLHSKWLSRVRVICLSTGELEGGRSWPTFVCFSTQPEAVDDDIQRE